jgi:hypothetical protein
LSRTVVFGAGACENCLFTKRLVGAKAGLVGEFDIGEDFDIGDVDFVANL